MGEGVLKDLGPCQVIFDGTSLGETLGDVIFRSTVESRQIREDSKGTTPVDEILIGAGVQVEVPMTRSSLAQLAAAIPGATISGSIMTVSSPVGQSQVGVAGVLVLKPLTGAGLQVGPQASWLTVPIAAPRTDLEITYNVENQRVYKVMFIGFADANGLLWKVGQ